MKSRTITLGISFFILNTGCLQETSESSEQSSLERFENISWQTDFEKKELKKYVYEEDQLVKLYVYDLDTSIKQLQIYSNGDKDSLYVYSRKGELLEMRDYQRVDGQNATLNTYIKYDSNSRIITEESYFYEILNSQTSYQINQNYFLDVRLVGTETKSSSRLIEGRIGDFDENFRLLSDSVLTIEYSEDCDCIKIPFRAKERGLERIRFEIIEFEQVDSGYWGRPVYCTYEINVN